MIKLKSLIIEGFGEKTALEVETEEFRQSLIHQYPQLDDLFLHIGYRQDVLYLGNIRIKKEFRNQGIGRKIIEAIKSFADKHELIITLSPEAEHGYKKKLKNYYKSLGFVANRGRKKDYRYSSFFGPTMLRRPDIKKLTEAFELPPEMDVQAEKLGKFIASIFLKDLRIKFSKAKTKSSNLIVKYNEDYRLAKQYRDEGNPLFSVRRDDTPTKWGQASLRIYSKIPNNTLPDVVLEITNDQDASNEGYAENVEEPQEIFILVNKNSFIKSFKQSTEELIDTVKHEIRHWRQFTDVIGLPKTKILNRDVDVFGTALKPNFFGYIPVEKHHMQDIEFKTNLHTYKFYIKRFLNRNLPKPQWKKEFNDIVSGKILNTGDDKMVAVIIDNLEHMMKKDPSRWRQFVKELYKLIFPSELKEIRSPHRVAQNTDKRRGYIGIVYHDKIEAYDEMIPDVIASNHIDFTHHIGAKWRFFVEFPKNTVLWDEFPADRDDKLRVEDWLHKRNMKVDKHIGVREYYRITNFPGHHT